MAQKRASPFEKGFWTWDRETNSLFFNRTDGKDYITSPSATVQQNVIAKKATVSNYSLRFNEPDTASKNYFKRYLSRRAPVNAPNVITIGDCKDLTLFLANYQDLSLSFIRLVHMPEVDTFIRSVIVYCQYYTQCWYYKLDPRISPDIYKGNPTFFKFKKDKMRDNLCELRCLVGIHYSAVTKIALKLCVTGERNVSTSGFLIKERALMEWFLSFVSKMVFLAMNRKHVKVIELEMTRLFKFTKISLDDSIYDHTTKNLQNNYTLKGPNVMNESCVFQHSAVVQEIMYGVHDFRLGLLNTGLLPKSERYEYLEKVIHAPEYMFEENGIEIGILGMKRELFDDMLKPIDPKKINMNKDFYFPPQEESEPHDFDLKKISPVYTESEDAKMVRKKQMKKWFKYLKEVQAHENAMLANADNLSFYSFIQI